MPAHGRLWETRDGYGGAVEISSRLALDIMPAIRALHLMDKCGFPVGRFEPYDIVVTTTLQPPGRFAGDLV